ncbi:MAG TPA: metal ABC transporter substrate-binding protein [Candidatus Limnocylindrales bacterium]|nr:metal ABC transporter substrate-binding protein [Candidatus Limnocylindrales bacterium]
MIGGRAARLVLLAASAVAGLAAFAGCTASIATPRPGPISVVATTTVFADLVANVGGDRVTVTSLVPANGDVHTFAARPSDMRAVAGARLLVMNGLGLDDWLQGTLANAAAPGTPILRLGENLPGVQLIVGLDATVPNPHLWLDVAYARLYVDRIAAALSAVDPTHAADYQAGHDAYDARLTALDAAVRSRLAAIPEANRKVVMFHDAFPYFGRAYGLTIVGVAVAAPGQDPSAGYTAQLIDAIRQAGAKAIFSERQFPTRLVDQLSSETGVRVVADLYDDTLGDPPVTSYVALIDWDVQRIAEALGS